LNEKLGTLESEIESLTHVNEALKQEINAKLVMVDELQEKCLAVHERTVADLTEERLRGLELRSAAESRNAEIENQLREVTQKIAQKEAEITNLTEKMALLESENEKLAGMNEALKGEVDAKLTMFNELQERFNSTHAEKEEAAEKIAVHEGTISHLTEVHTRSLELHSAAESKNEEIEAQFRETLETIARKEAEVKDLSEKLDALEIELGYYEEQATEAAATEENHKVKYDEAAQKIKSLEEQLAEAQRKVEHFLAEKENLSLANSSLNVKLKEHQNKLNELHLALAAVVAEKEAASEEIHSLHKTLEGMSQRKEELEIQVIKYFLY
jgi:golgin subfamily A member 4